MVREGTPNLPKGQGDQMIEKDKNKKNAIVPMGSLQAMLNADKTVVTKDEIFNVIMVEQEHKLKEAMAGKRTAIRDLKSLREEAIMELNAGTIKAVESKIPEHAGVHKSVQAIFSVPDLDKDEHEFSYKVTISSTKKLIDAVSNTYRISNGHINSEVSRKLRELEEHKELYFIFKTKYQPLNLALIGQTTAKVPKKLLKLVEEITSLDEQTEETIADISLLQRQLQEMPALERAARAKFTALALEGTDNGRAILDELRNSTEMKSVLAIAAGQH